ncbi:MAG: acylase [Spirochaetes bacterium]|nr:MAG: acylase [Spirochaetota bacterium]
MNIRNIIPYALALCIAVMPFACSRNDGTDAEMRLLGEKYQVRILRDSWGVPHVFGKTDADTAFGIAYAHAQDDFKTIQLILTAVNGRLGTVLGRDGAGNDFLVHLIRLWDTVNAKYETDLTPRSRTICEAYADGINYYAALHPDEALPGLYPVSGKHVVAGFVHKMPLMVGVDMVLKELFTGEKSASAGPGDDILRSAFNGSAFSKVVPRIGSNAIAVSPLRSAGGETFLAVNSHQPWEGPVSWYELQAHSEEGWNMTGGLFPGSPVVLHGHNEFLGWAHTNNYPDLVDVYALEMNPDDPNQYRFDGAWRELEIRKAPIKVKLLGPLSWTFNEEVLWCVYGPAVRRPHGVFAIRYAALGDIRQVEQWYRMNKARSIEEWEGAVRMGTLPMFNCTYADSRGTIFYLYQALMPLRDEGYDWKKTLPGSTSKTLWTKYLPYERLPQVKNPASGFVMNCNNTPFRTTVGEGNPRRADFAPSLGIEDRMTNRGLRALELFGADESITWKEFHDYKYDMRYSRESKIAKIRARVTSLDMGTDPLLAEARAVMGTWDLSADPGNKGTALAIHTYWNLLGPQGSRAVDDVSDEELRAGFAKAANLMKDTLGGLRVPWSTVNRLIRGTVDLGLGGGPDTLHCVEGDTRKDGRFRGKVGDSYVLLVAWDADGRVRSQSIHVYGSATLDENSPHYADQAPLFAKRELKPAWRTEADIRAHLEREYRPGEEMKGIR